MKANRLWTAVGILLVLNVCLLSLVTFHYLGEPQKEMTRHLVEGASSLMATPVQAQNPAVSPSRGLPDLSISAARISPSLVGIGAVHTVVQRAWIQDYFSRFIVPMDTEEKQRIPYLGSGVIISKDGLVVTNHHVVEDSEDLFVTMQDGREVKAKLLDADKILDVAVLKLEVDNCVPAEIGDSTALREGEWVLAVGNPFANMMSDPHATVTVGVVSALKRSFSPEQGRQRVYRDMIQTDAAINPGNSGGALVNSQGQLIGINTFIFSQSGGSNGIGFAIPINRVMRVVKEIREHGKIRNLYPDFKVSNLNRQMAQHLNLKSTLGVYVLSIERNSAASQAGLAPGDVILAVDGQSADSIEWFWTLFAAHFVGDNVELTILRDGKAQHIVYTIPDRGGKEQVIGLA